MTTRTERDPLGERAVPADAYYGIQTARALENFPISGLLDQNGSVDEKGGRTKPADRKVLERARRLNAVVGVSRNRPFAERVAFYASGHGDLQGASFPNHGRPSGTYPPFVLFQRIQTSKLY